ncbi:MAG TPA: hypothetical protein VKY59_11945 [Spirillospora sp.]|nr:hypothetical protein [Spirillospora sp.]
MSEWVRLIATGMIWGCLAVVLTLGGSYSGEIVPLTLILGIAATISTVKIWESGRAVQAGDAGDAAGKQKRDNRFARLVDKLDEDEVYQLEELLASRRDEEIVRRSQR